MKLQAETSVEEGFAVVPNVLASEEVDELLHGASEFPKSRAGMRHLMRFKSVTSIAHDPRLMQLACTAVGDGAAPFRATLFDKSNDANWLVVWHQDTALPLTERRHDPGWGSWSMKEGIAYAHAPAWALQEVIALRVSLDDSGEDNGPLRVLPGTHALGVLTDSEIEREVARRLPHICTVNRGGVVIMRPLILHASSKSKSSQPRRVLHIEYASRALQDNVNLAIA